jgi:hypothetical protein
MNIKWFTAVLCTVVLAGCGSFQPQSTPPATSHYQRFVPIQPVSGMVEGIPWHGYFALDTKTGTLCRTIMLKVFPKGVSEWVNDVPSCYDTFKVSPD